MIVVFSHQSKADKVCEVKFSEQLEQDLFRGRTNQFQLRNQFNRIKQVT